MLSTPTTSNVFSPELVVIRPEEIVPDADWQRCVVHAYRNVFTHVPRTKMRHVSAMLKAIHAQESREAALAKADDVVAALRSMKLKTAADWVAEHIDETYISLDSEYRDCSFTNNWLKE